VQINASPASPAVLAPLADRVRESLVATGLFSDVEVEHTDQVDHLVIGMCSFGDDIDESEVALRLERLWRTGLRYDFWEAHSLLVSRGQVELQGATRSSSYGHYVTIHLVAQKVRVPAQRAAVAHEAPLAPA
jgi:hypothetical protein